MISLMSLIQPAPSEKGSARHSEGAVRWAMVGKVASDEGRDKGGFGQCGGFQRKIRINQAKYLEIDYVNAFMFLFIFYRSKHCTN
jgi:hypothetical protein